MSCAARDVNYKYFQFNLKVLKCLKMYILLMKKCDYANEKNPYLPFFDTNQT